MACSPPGAALCYELISNELSLLQKDSAATLEVSMHAFPLSEYMRCIEIDNWMGVARLMLSSTEKLAAVGADFVVAPCNTIHKAFDQVAASSPLPWLHIGAETAAEAKHRGSQCVALLGTSLTLESNIYSSQFDRLGVRYRIPKKSDRERLDRFIFDEMVRGQFTSEARQYVLELTDDLRSQGCDAVGLCCTELPILMASVDLPLSALDSTRALAAAAVKRVAESQPQPSKPEAAQARLPAR
jgi:aspartate racemase